MEVGADYMDTICMVFLFKGGSEEKDLPKKYDVRRKRKVMIVNMHIHINPHTFFLYILAWITT